MPPHLIRRAGKKGASYYLVDGRYRKTLKTQVKRYAEARLDKHNKGKLRLTDGMTVGEFYEQWIQQKQNDETLRKNLVVSYRQHFSCYILSEFKFQSLGAMCLANISLFRSKLLQNGMSPKTVRNILDGSFRA